MKRKSFILLCILIALTAALLLGCSKEDVSGAQTETEGTEIGEEDKEMKPIEIQTIETEKFSMDYFTFGHGEKNLVILPGLSVQSVMGLADVVADSYSEMTDEFTLYLFDRRKDLPDVYTWEEMARDTEEAIEAIGLRKTSIFGASQGGMLTLKIAIDKPEMVEAVIVASTTAQMTENRFRPIEKWISLAEEKNAEELYLAFGEAIYPSDVFRQSRDLLLESAKTVTDEEMERMAILAKSIKNFDVTGELSKVQCPVLIIGDSADEIFGAEAAEQIYEYLKDKPGCDIYIYEGYGHAVYDMAPDFKERMTNFLLSN